MAESSVDKIKPADSLNEHAEISVPESEKRVNGSLNLREYYTVYLVEIKAIDPEFETKLSKLDTVWRRYTDFEQLRAHLELTYPYIVIPPLPEKRILFGWQKTATDTFDPDFVDRRRAGLENFLLRVAAHPALCYDEQFVEFLVHDDKWQETVKSNGGYLHRAESSLRHTLTYTPRLRAPDPRFTAVRRYSHELHATLYALLRGRARVATAQYTVYRLHGNYGRVFSEWSVMVEPDLGGGGGGGTGRRQNGVKGGGGTTATTGTAVCWGDALQKAGHYMDSHAASVDAVLEDEELFVDQLKEYLFYALSLQKVCKHQEQLKMGVEGAEDNITAKNAERAKAEQGKLGLISRLFGAIDTDEVRELKVNMLDQEIEEGTTTVNNSKEDLKKFSNRAITDIEKFQKQKVLDLKETLASYAFLQLKTAKKGLQTWTQIRECLQNI